MDVMKRCAVAITGASGVVYGLRAVEALLEAGVEVHLVVSEPARLVLAQEQGWDERTPLEEECRRRLRLPTGSKLVVYGNHDIAAPLASGSFGMEAMVVIPCSMSTLSSIAHGSADSLIERAADVMLKERRPLVLVPRETPLNTIHLRNMLAAAEAGAAILPAMPAFYHAPATVEDMVQFVVGKLLDLLRVPHRAFAPYRGVP
ncbi:MAG: flavin prenyltransferase UbiX [Syntrophomonadaceae bacterium]|jgi:4-hydroxy-3-polyprenylbenzoate decarboxylase|nr:UbiX family flavin prenyltransferase [Syntrophomonadaceae bacterium]MDH7498647.1 flavin prenyltransferase UbiX [Syntrophomonadaceae bacterium]